MSEAGKPRAHDYLGHILEAIQRIKEYTGNMTEVAFLADRKTQDAVIRNLEIIGEASNNIEKREPGFAREHPDVPWGIAYEMRNVLTHGYFKVDLEIVWKTIKTDLPVLEQKIRSLLGRLSDAAP